MDTFNEFMVAGSRGERWSIASNNYTFEFFPDDSVKAFKLIVDSEGVNARESGYLFDSVAPGGKLWLNITLRDQFY